jgi:hypothetical protein
MRHAAQCVGRAIRGKTDYGIMIFADKVHSELIYCGNNMNSAVLGKLILCIYCRGSLVLTNAASCPSGYKNISKIHYATCQLKRLSRYETEEYL